MQYRPYLSTNRSQTQNIHILTTEQSGLFVVVGAVVIITVVAIYLLDELNWMSFLKTYHFISEKTQWCCVETPHDHLLDFFYFLEDMTCHCKIRELSFSFDYSVNFYLSWNR